MHNNELKKKPYWYVKRIIDIVLSIILIVITLPIMIISAMLLFISLGSPISNQRRYREGLYKKKFLMYKLRTKKLDVDDKPRKDRYTKLSYIIDKLKFNELPQLFNVLIGQMSFIGPRPFIPGEKLPAGEISDKRYYVRPGLTNLAYVSKNGLASHKTKLKLDVEYYDNFSFKQDFIILLKTPIYIIKRFK